MQWENQNPVVSWIPRAGSVLLAAGGLLGVGYLAFSERDAVFTALQVVLLAPWLTLTIWSAWRDVAVRTVSLEPDAQLIHLGVGTGTRTLPFTDVSSIGLNRGLIYIQSRADRGGALLGRAYILALYDQPLRDFVAACTQVGIRVTREPAVFAGGPPE